MNSIQIDLGFILHIILGSIFAIFFFVYHWFAYDALFVSGIECRASAYPLWVSTLVIIIIQLAAIPLGVLCLIIFRMLTKFQDLLPENEPTKTDNVEKSETTNEFETVIEL